MSSPYQKKRRRIGIPGFSGILGGQALCPLAGPIGILAAVHGIRPVGTQQARNQQARYYRFSFILFHTFSPIPVPELHFRHRTSDFSEVFPPPCWNAPFHQS